MTAMEDRKVYLDKHSNLLQLEEHMYPLVDVDKPNVFRNLFHYDEVPKTRFVGSFPWVLPVCADNHRWLRSAPYYTELWTADHPGK